MIYNSRNSKDLIVFLEVERSEDIYNSRNSKDLIVVFFSFAFAGDLQQ